MFFTPPVGALIAATLSTFGIYLFASILYCDSWHMFNSFFQYLCLAPSFINVLNVYAFCNLHDVSWGTKGFDKAEVLQSVKSSKSKVNKRVFVADDEEPRPEDRDAAYEEAVIRANGKLGVKEGRETASLDDQNKTFRTRLVVFWMLMNAALVIAIENINGLPSSNPTTDEQDLRKRQNYYFALILYSVSGLAAVRFIGCLWYLFKHRQFRRSSNANVV